MVVKAQVVRRLVKTDPDSAETHAGDIERIGRRALIDVRQAVDAMRAPSFAGELEEVLRAFDAAGVATTVDCPGGPPVGKADEVLAWVLREGATNLIRHSGATACRIEVAEHDGQVALSMVDNGVGPPGAFTARAGGLAGLRDRLAAVGGGLSAGRQEDGFSLVASVPESTR